MTKNAATSRKPSPFSLLQQIYAEIEVSPKKIRDFGLVMLLIPGLLIPGMLYWISGGFGLLSQCLMAFGVFIALLSRLAPATLHGFYRGWMSLAVVLGLFMTKVIITLVFYGMMMPIGLGRQLWVGDPLKMKRDPKQDSYWIKRDIAENAIKPEKYEKQY